MLNQSAINEFQACSLDKIIISVAKKLWPCASNALPNEPEVRETVHAMTATASVQIGQEMKQRIRRSAMQPRKPRLMLPDGHLGIKASKSSSSILNCVAKNKPFCK